MKPDGIVREMTDCDMFIQQVSIYYEENFNVVITFYHPPHNSIKLH